MKSVRRMTIAVGTLLSAVSCAGAREAVLSPPTAVSPGRGTAVVPASPVASPVLGIQAPRIPDRVCPLAEHGARGDGTTNDTAAINQAIAACHGAGGGTVRFPPGTYRAASIRLLSRIRLQLEAGATLQALEEGYDPPEPNPFDKYQDFGHSHFRNSLIWGEGVTDVAIEGPGRSRAGPCAVATPARARATSRSPSRAASGWRSAT